MNKPNGLTDLHKKDFLAFPKDRSVDSCYKEMVQSVNEIHHALLAPLVDFIGADSSTYSNNTDEILQMILAVPATEIHLCQPGHKKY